MAFKRILLVEDDIDIRENMALVLQYEGYQVFQAEHCAEAMKFLNENKTHLPDVILLDLFMPVMNGREFLDVIAEGTEEALKKIPVILLTASEQNVRQDLEGRTVAILRKPIDLKPFLNMLSTILK